VFTEHVRALVEGEAVEGPKFDELWQALRAALRREIKRRGLWESPPAYLGIYGWESWEPSGSRRGKGGADSALDELLPECYSFVFVSRLRSLEAHRKLKPNVDGLVFLNIRHFLHERQREHDPIGSQVFAVLQTAVRMAVAAGELAVIEGDVRIKNDTVLVFGPAASPAAGGDLPAVVTRWNDELLPDLVTSRGRRQEEVARRLRDHLLALRRRGYGAVRFKDLVDPLKADVRARWAALLERAQGESAVEVSAEGTPETVRLVGPDTRAEEREVFRKLVDCVLAALERLQVSEKTRAYLATLWQFIRVQASEGVEASPGSLGEGLAELAEAEEGRPSLRTLAEELRIPRERLPGLYQTLGELLEGCRAAISGEAAVNSLREKAKYSDRRPGADEH
jgi:hypothetical protein